MKAAIKVIPIILIIAAFSAIMCLNAICVDYSVNYLTVYGMQTIDSSSNTWHSIPYTFDNGIVKSNYLSAGQYRISLSLNLNSTVVTHIKIKYKLVVNHSNLNEYSDFARLSFNSNVLYDINLSVVNSGNTYFFEGERSFNNIVIDNVSLNNGITFVSSDITISDIEISINAETYEIKSDIQDIKNDVDTIQQDISDIKDAIVGTETIPIDNSGEDHLLDKLDEETGVINDMIDEFRAFDISKYTGGIYAVMYMSTPWTNQEWFKAVMVVLLTLFALITVVRGLRR